jgi:uncharacterized cupin superfamily protein
MLILLAAMCLLGREAGVVQTPPAPEPVQPPRPATTATASQQNPFFGEWEATEGRIRWINGHSEPLKEGRIKI